MRISFDGIYIFRWPFLERKGETVLTMKPRIFNKEIPRVEAKICKLLEATRSGDQKVLLVHKGNLKELCSFLSVACNNERICMGWLWLEDKFFVKELWNIGLYYNVAGIVSDIAERATSYGIALGVSIADESLSLVGLDSHVKKPQTMDKLLLQWNEYVVNNWTLGIFPEKFSVFMSKRSCSNERKRV